MDYTPQGTACLLLLTILLHVTHRVTSWDDWSPNVVSREPEILDIQEKFRSEYGGNESFKMLLVEGDKIFIGGKDRLYYLRAKDLRNVTALDWAADDISQNKCRLNSKTDCTNYIRVVVRKEDALYVCGTNAYIPVCRHYYISANDSLVMQRGAGASGEDPGTAICPFDNVSNATALYADGKLYTSTRSRADGSGPLILQSNTHNNIKIRTQEGNSKVLNDPQFISSYDMDDKIYFFFREAAVENINCGKAVFSRVARVCKQDTGGAPWRSQFTSFFKARLNCSLPGEYPFYFDELQSTTDFGQGNHRPTRFSGDRSPIIYGVFNTPSNSIHGSAVCAYSYSEIAKVFEGQFKGQETYKHSWLPVGWEVTPKNHPAKCVNDTRNDLTAESVKFAKMYPLMDQAVKPQGGQPLLAFTSLRARLTHIAVDFQLLAADGHYYDVIFVGTDDGRIIKAINKGQGTQVDTVVIEDRQVLEKGDPVVGLKLVISRSKHADQKLVVVSKDKVVAAPLERCSRAATCGSCVALQDPYCSWVPQIKQCVHAETGIQNIATGEHADCQQEDALDPHSSQKPLVSAEKEEISITDRECDCATQRLGTEHRKDFETDSDVVGKSLTGAHTVKIGASQNSGVAGAAIAGGASGGDGSPVEVLIIAVIVSILISLIVGFAIGYKFQDCRQRASDDVFYDQRCSSLQRNRRNRLSSGDNPHFHTDHTHLHPNHHLTPKQMNVVLGKGNQTSVVTKSNKVYL